MTLLLKSKVKSTASVGNIHGFTGPNDFAAFFDFMRGEYFTQSGGVRTDHNFNDILRIERASEARYFTRAGVERVAAPNTPRLGLDPASGMVGLIMERDGNNHITDDSDNASVAFGSFVQDICLSWEGSGDAHLESSNLTLERQGTLAGRKYKIYDRSDSAAFTATLKLQGEVSRVVAERSYPTSYMPPGTSRAIERLYLQPPWSDIFAHGDGTIVGRFRRFFYTEEMNGGGQVSFMQVRNTDALDGGIYYRVNFAHTGTGLTDGVKVVEDGGNEPLTSDAAHVVGSGRADFVGGIRFEDFGAKAGVISKRQIRTNDSTGKAVGALDEVRIIGVTFMLTHLVLYDRFVSDDEALLLAQQWTT